MWRCSESTTNPWFLSIYGSKLSRNVSQEPEDAKTVTSLLQEIPRIQSTSIRGINVAEIDHGSQARQAFASVERPPKNLRLRWHNLAELGVTCGLWPIVPLALPLGTSRSC